jgi:3-oxoacyl-[acyl-carrier protein] reductase
MQGRVALVTGGSGGLGSALCRALAGAGASVAIGYRSNAEAAEALARELVTNGRRAVAIGGDVSDPAQVQLMVERTVRALGPVGALVSNAGHVQVEDLDSLDTASWDETMAEHLRAAFLLTRAVVPGMRGAGWGRLLYVSSIAAFSGGFVGPHYAAAKAGLLGLMHWVAANHAAAGITANAIAPSLIDTGALPGDAATRRALVDGIPVHRFGTPEEFAEIALAVLTNAYLNGQTILLDGGRRPT